MAVDLRTYIFLDQLQRQMTGLIGTVSRGFLPLYQQACCVIEIAPGIEINRLTAIAVKAVNVRPGLQVVERSFGLLELHSDEQADARMAGQAVLAELGLTIEDRMRPRILTSQLIRHVIARHAQLINRVRFGNMIVHGDTLYVLEIEPAGYAYYAANEAEKFSHINIVDVSGYGKYGRVYIAGDEAEVRESQAIIEARLESISGREHHFKQAAEIAKKAKGES
jgi:hypothetical protein